VRSEIVFLGLFSILAFDVMISLRYSDALSAQIDAKTEIAVGSEAELEIRAATVVAVDRLCAALQAKGVKDVMPVTLDWLLWQRGEVLNNEQKIKPHHRVLTIFY
jgi:hypothetical protein